MSGPHPTTPTGLYSLRGEFRGEAPNSPQSFVRATIGSEESDHFVSVDTKNLPARGRLPPTKLLYRAQPYDYSMAKKGRGGSKRRRYLKGAIDVDFALGTLAAKDLISDTEDSVLTEEAWISSVLATWAIENFTQGAGDGPIVVGVAHPDYTNAEVEEFLENAGSWDQGNLIQQEIARRKIRQVGTFSATLLAATGGGALNDGNPIHTKCGWMLNTGISLRFWAYNMGTSALATTDPHVLVNGHANLWPR